MKKVIAVLPTEYKGKRYDLEISSTHNYFADGMLVHNCSLPKDTDLSKWPWDKGIYSQIKADGQFANISHHEKTGAVTIESRKGSPYPLEYFKDLVNGVRAIIPEGWQLHGELLISQGGKILAREVGNGMLNSILQGGELEKGCIPVYHVWDAIPISEAKSKNKFNEIYQIRFACLRSWMQKNTNGHIQLIDYKIVYSLEEAYAHYKECVVNGLEGTVIKHPDGIWEDTTSKNQVKLKLEFEVELLVTGANPADSKSKNASTFGSLQCQSSDGKLRVGVTGIKDAKRKEIFENLESWKSKMIITVRANGIMNPSSDTGGYWSLFLPRFIEERLDKTEADSLVRIQEIQKAAIEATDMTKD